MIESILRCCSNKSIFLVTYELGSQYFVCSKCITLTHWARGKKEIKELGKESCTN